MINDEFNFSSQEEKLRLQSLIRSLLDKNGNPNKLKKKTLLSAEDEAKLLQVSKLEDLNAAMYSILHEKKGFCEICKTPILKLDSFQKGFKRACSNSCAGKMGANEVERKNMELYGVKHHNQLKESNEKRAKTNLERYGAKTYVASKEGKEKIKKNNLEKRGVEHHMKDKEFVRNSGYNEKWSSEKKQAWSEKTEQTNLERRGVKHHQSTKDWKELIEKKSLDRYGVPNVSMAQEVSDKISKTHQSKSEKEKKEIQFRRENTSLQKFGVKSYVLTEEAKLLSLLKSKRGIDKKFNDLVLSKDVVGIKNYLTEINDKLNPSYHCRLHVAKYLGYSNASSLNAILRRFDLQNFLISKGYGYSAFELEISNYVSSLGVTSKKDRTILDGKELDIYCEKEKFAIEANGVYTHSEQEGKHKFYHFEKSQICSQKGIKLYHIFEDEWNLKQEIVKGMIKSSLGKNEIKIQARKCEIKEVSYNETKDFLEENHIQGFAIGHLKSYGLFFEGTLVQIMTFSKPRFNSFYEWELLRSCAKINHSVSGGVSKLFSHFVKQTDPKNVICYSDCRFGGFGETVYDKFMTLEYLTNPGWRAADKNKKVLKSRSNFTKTEMKKRHPDYDDSLTVSENMEKFGYLKVWDVGQKVYSWTS